MSAYAPISSSDAGGPAADRPSHQNARSRSSNNTNRYSASSFFSYPVSRTVSGLLRRISTEPSSSNDLASSMGGLKPNTSSVPGVYTPPRRHASPFQPPPLSPLNLDGWKPGTADRSKLLSRQLAEEIRLLIPPRLQLVEDWKLAYSLEQDGVSLATLYKNCEDLRGKRGGYVLVVRDGGGGIFGAYLTDAPHPNPHFFGTGECFLWRAHVLPGLPSLANLPPPPSADTTNAQRMTTIAQPKHHLSPPNSNAPSNGGSGASTPERIRFKAFPYSGVNDYMLFCEQGFLSVGGGDGHYGLWLDDNLENGISSSCPTFGNEPLSDEGEKFDVLGVELWFIG
ncbi:oxidation resistance protein 1 [Diplodia corticola]|uniref:Oxidation resistance protein 1 n=1 Tax=Diplodia corticola TaxID=236234 RepID=A0A1J9RZC5_9PEZI|nr:oxidation resistance protein 1 [Diplodia corticola]OJD38027.1 oxidation resistance protein 1 [Diplodia corticola]